MMIKVTDGGDCDDDSDRWGESEEGGTGKPWMKALFKNLNTTPIKKYYTSLLVINPVHQEQSESQIQVILVPQSSPSPSIRFCEFLTAV